MKRQDFSFDEEPEKKSDNLFAWTVVILLLIGFALACWIGSFYVFGHPEKPFSYALLTKLKKLDPPKRFEITAAPRGEFLNAKQLLERYGNLTPRELARANEALLRNYLRNYKLTQDLVPYVVGSFSILDSYELSGSDIFGSGVVAVTQSIDTPGVLLEQIFTAEAKDVPTLHRMLLTGLDLRLERTIDLSALIHVERMADGRLLFTSVPILYGSYAASTGPGSFSLDPPTDINLEAGLPVVKQDRMNEADQKLAAFQRKSGPAATAGATPRPQTQLVRVERPEPVNPLPVPVVSPTPLGDDAPVLPAIPVNPLDQPVAIATPTPSPTPGDAVAAPSPTPSTIATTAGGSWPVYAPGQMPRGRLLGVTDMRDLASRGVAGERIYLQGNFTVTASGASRAVLRVQGGLPDAIGLGNSNNTKTRVIVDFPAGSRPPEMGASFSRDSRRPFMITKIEEGAGGEVNVWVREVTRP